MRTRVVTVLLAMVSVFAAAAVFAWEFKMKGDSEWRYRYWERTGEDDIFGRMSADGVNLGVNHLATWPSMATQTAASGTFGVLAGENNFGSDISSVDFRCTLYPTIKVNKAIRIRAGVNLTSLGIYSDGEPLAGLPSNVIPHAGAFTNFGYVNSLYLPLGTRPAAVDVPNTYVTLQWLKWSIKTPMVDFSLGYKTSKLGMGLWKHHDTRASASFGFKVKYGPLAIGFSPYWTRRNSDWRAGRNPGAAPGAGFPRGRDVGEDAQYRKEHIRNYFRAFMGDIQYKNGPFVMRIVSDSYAQEAHNEIDNHNQRAGDLQGDLEDPDRWRYRFHVSAAYYNGRFFWNGEADWFLSWRSGEDIRETAVLVEEAYNSDGWLCGTEFGLLAGPCKLTLNYIRATGDDPNTRDTGESSFQGDSGVNDAYMRGWGYLMYHLYGTGTCFGANGFGYPFDLHHAGGRVDHAVASNLNVWGLFSYAWRDQPNAWKWGGDGRIGVEAFTNDDLIAAQAGDTTRIPVPDHAREIGWEVDLGCSWRLLENFTWNTTVAYWQPGNWWGYAMPNTAAIYRANGGAAIVADDYLNARVNPGREIDPFVAVETNLVIDF